MSKEDYLEKAIAWAKSKSISSLKVNHEDYESPKTFTNNSTQESIQPDISFEQRGGKFYTEIAIKTDNPRKLVTRWKLLSLMATMKKGKLFLLAPKGHKMFTQKLVDNHNINAIIYSL